jgi:hypothetical protein
MLANTGRLAHRSHLAFSKVTNGRKLLRGVDLRTEAGRRYRDLCVCYRQGLGELDERQMSLIRTAAGIGVKLEQLQAAIVNGEPIDTRILVRLANSQARALRVLGEMKTAKASEVDVDALERHLAKMAAKRQAAEAAAENEVR